MQTAGRDRFQRLIDWTGKLIQLLLHVSGVIIALFLTYLVTKGCLLLLSFLEGLGS